MAEAISTNISAEFSFPSKGTIVPASEASFPSRLDEVFSPEPYITEGSFL